MLRKLITKAVIKRELPANPFDGEMLPLERLRLFKWMQVHRPRVVLEVGAGVGGSTFYLSEALKQYGGKLYTCDPMRKPPQDFLDRFAGTLDFRSLKSVELIDELIAQNIVPDMLFFDGPEIPELALEDLQRLEPVIPHGCLFAMHDWELIGGRNKKIISIKSEQVRPYIEQSSDWEPLEVLSGHQKNVWWTKGRWDSVGLCLYRYQGNAARATVAA
ncbi:class I SAM-dependent methyltransferase [Rosistilla oblonga]|uniref:class I SAM-dependent methyltransferase n=1 Tax=Rosistilla oblonga TaxID=2527990 RepID=UPI003A97D097